MFRLGFVLTACALAAYGQSGQLDASKTLFTVLAAINASGYDAEIDSPSNHPLRKAVRDEIARRKPAVVADIRAFMREHRQEDATWELRQYVSYALLVSDPPKFAWRMKEYQLPPDVAALKDFAPLLAKFYDQAGIEDLWQRSQPAYDQALARYQGPVIQAVQEVSGYLRAPLNGTFMGREFRVVIDLLGAPNQIHARTFLDEYFLVATHSAEPQVADIRRQYLHYLVDPLVTKYAAQIDEKKGMGDFAQGAPFLADHFKQDFLLLATRSLIRAIEARLAHSSQRQKMVDQAMGEGFVATAHFAEQLPVYEKQELAMRMYFPDLISSIDLSKEETRLNKLEFAAARPTRKAKSVAAPPPPESTPGEKAWEEAEDFYYKRDLVKAREAYGKVIDATTEKPLQAKAYYGLARIAMLNKDPESAEKLFAKSLELHPPAPEKSWVLYYLGRLSEASGEPDVALARFRAAVALDGGSPKAREAAAKALEQSGKK